MGLATPYLVLYNACCLAGWCFALVAGIKTVAAGDGALAARLGAVWAEVGDVVFYVQFAMALEIGHAALGLVRSPLVTTAMQVTSRLWIVLVPYVDAPCRIGEQWSVGLMVLSWACVECIRYAFYLSALLLPKVPYPVFWARYSAFALLYPTGITGELLTAYWGLHCGQLTPWHKLMQFIVALYVPGSPFMYMNMVGNRKSAFKKRFAPPPKPARGCAFPLDAKGARSTTAPNRTAVAVAIEACGSPNSAAAAQKCAREKAYRFGYAGHVRSLVIEGAWSAAGAVESARAGLNWLYGHFQFVSRDGEACAFGAAVAPDSKATVSGRSLTSVIVPGGKKGKTLAYSVPYDGGWHPTRPEAPAGALSGVALQDQCDLWVENGHVERDASHAISWTADYFKSGGSLSGCHFVLIGAGSAMGPCAKLLEMGANVVAVDIPGVWGKGGKRPASGLWKRLFGLAKASPGGSLTVPVSSDFKGGAGDLDALAEAAGCDLMMEPKEIGDWLEAWIKTLPTSARVCVGNYTYLDGELHVKLALCADSLIDKVLRASTRLARPAACAFLCTPTDAHLVPKDARDAAVAAYGSGLRNFGAEKLFNVMTGGAKLRANFEAPIKTKSGKDAYMVDGLSVAQGPNYALAKRMQHWRAVLAYDGGHVASTMIAPSTATISVIHNKTFAWAYGGMPSFGYEIFKQETTNAVMTAVLLHDVLNDDGPKNPANKAKFGVDNPLKLFSSESVHGGLWRSPYAVDSLGEASALIYFAGLAQPYAIGCAVVAMAAYYKTLLA